jgi:hypothetical protein
MVAYRPSYKLPRSSKNNPVSERIDAPVNLINLPYCVLNTLKPLILAPGLKKIDRYKSSQECKKKLAGLVY